MNRTAGRLLSLLALCGVAGACPNGSTVTVKPPEHPIAGNYVAPDLSALQQPLKAVHGRKVREETLDWDIWKKIGSTIGTYRDDSPAVARCDKDGNFLISWKPRNKVAEIYRSDIVRSYIRFHEYAHFEARDVIPDPRGSGCKILDAAKKRELAADCRAVHHVRSLGKSHGERVADIVYGALWGSERGGSRTHPSDRDRALEFQRCRLSDGRRVEAPPGN